MLKVLVHYPDWHNRWEPYILAELRSRYDVTVSHSENRDEILALSRDQDVLLSMWCNGVVGLWTQLLPDKPIITYLRRFEMWNDRMMNMVDFNHVDAMIWLNEYYTERFNHAIGENQIRHYIIPNGIDLDEWQIPERRGDPHKIALIASMKHVKNIPLAAAILAELPERFHIHHIGLWTENFTGELTSYIHALGLNKRWHWEPKIYRDEVAGWLADKGILLNPSINEGNPNCVIEAMAMGIRPVIHAWPGAYGQFPEQTIFRTVSEAVAKIQFNPYVDRKFYRDWVAARFSLENFKGIHAVIDDVMEGRP